MNPQFVQELSFIQKMKKTHNKAIKAFCAAYDGVICTGDVVFRNKWKISFFVSILLLISSNLYWLVALIDQGVTNTYLSYEYDDANKSIKSLGELIVKGASEYNQKNILHLLMQADLTAALHSAFISFATLSPW